MRNRAADVPLQGTTLFPALTGAAPLPLLRAGAEAPDAPREATAGRAIGVWAPVADPFRPQWSEVTGAFGRPEGFVSGSARSVANPIPPQWNEETATALGRPDGLVHWSSAEPAPGARAAETLTALSSLRALPRART
ncbi:hypothetical protein AB0O01_01725 [Streptomyces sp. NPDC093252]|uniref:hypothetical protein n=1 Tax=Streptomyces sp. NPDC093252 TaxID=3154980 RepID=UPI00341F79F7